MSKKKSDTIEDKNSEQKADFFLQLYPPVKDFYDLDREYDLYNKKNFPKFLSNGINEDINSDKEEDIYEINADFFGSLLGKNNYYLNKEKKIKTISKLILKSKLMEKLEKDNHGSSKKIDLCSLSTMCAKNLSFMELKKGKVLFKIGDKGDRFYFILSGKITILKPRQINCKMSLQEYLYYLIILIREKEEYLLNEVILNNCTQVPVTTVEEIKNIYKILFMLNLKNHLYNGTIDNNNQLKIFFDKNFQTFHEYNLDIKYLEILEQKKSKIAGNAQWSIYILQNCNLTKADIRTLGRFKEYNEKKNILCYVYDSFLYLGPGFFFGDSALEEKINKRNATIRAEEDTVLGFLKSVDYLNMIAPQRKIEKMNEINFLINNFFFKNINISIFEKKFFHLFTLNENNRNTILFNCGSIPKSLFFLKEGKVSLTLKCSIIDINKIIKNICNKVIKQYCKELYKKNIITKEKINILKGYLEEDKVLTNLKNYTKQFVREINKNRIFQIAVFNEADTIGLEEIFLQIPYITQGVVTSEKIIFYKLSMEKIRTILLENHHINYFYLKSAINKVFSLIKRFYNLKQNYIDIAKMRYENPNSFRNKNIPNLKNNNNDNLIENKNIEMFSTLSHNYSFPRLSNKKIKISRNIGTEIKKTEKENKEYQILSYSDNKTKKQDDNENNDNNDLYKNIVSYRTPLSKMPYIKNKIFLSILLDSKTGSKNKNEKKEHLNIKNHNDNIIKIINNDISNIVNINNNKQTKFLDFQNSLKKSKNNNIIRLKIYEDNNQKEENKGKNSEIINNKERLFSDLNNQSFDTIQIGDKSVTLEGLKRKIRKSDCQIFKNRKKLLRIIQSNNYYLENQKNTNNNLYQKEINTNSSIKTEDNSFEKDNKLTNLNKREKSSIIRKIYEIKNYHLSFVPLLNENENIFECNKNNNNNNDKNKNNNDNCISLLINNENKPNYIKTISKKNLILKNNCSFNYNNRKLFLQKLLFNKKSLSNINLFDKNELPKNKIDYGNNSDSKRNINNCDFSFNNINSKNEKQLLPSIVRKNIDLNKSNELKKETILNINKKELIHEIIKNYYNDKKIKGYASLIPNKESNTLFLRRFHKKYNQIDKSNNIK